MGDVLVVGLIYTFVRIFLPERVRLLPLYIFLFAAGASLTVHLQKRRIYFGAVVIMTLFGLAGSLAGSATAMSIDGEILSKIFGAMMIAAGGYSLIPRRAYFS